MTTPVLPVLVQTQVMSQQGVKIYVPQISGLTNTHIQQMINETIQQETMQLVQKQHNQQQVQMFAEMIGMYEIKTNERNVLSLLLTNYAIGTYHANGLTIYKGLTFDLSTGKVVPFNKLFRPGSDYKRLISSLVQKQIKERDIPLLDTFPGIQSNQPYYISDQTLVVFFQPLDITPHYVGAPMFPIPIYQLESVLPRNGILENMYTG